MVEVIKHIPKDELCQFCKKRKATLLCDMPHSTITRHARGRGFESYTMTCDKKICTRCTTHINGFDFCPDCVRKIKATSKGMRESEEWADSEYAEPPVDWGKVPVDTPILVRHGEKDTWIRRYFAKCENGMVYAWEGGATSWSADGPTDVCDWKYAKVAESEL